MAHPLSEVPCGWILWWFWFCWLALEHCSFLSKIQLAFNWHITILYIYKLFQYCCLYQPRPQYQDTWINLCPVLPTETHSTDHSVLAKQPLLALCEPVLLPAEKSEGFYWVILVTPWWNEPFHIIWFLWRRILNPRKMGGGLVQEHTSHMSATCRMLITFWTLVLGRGMFKTHSECGKLQQFIMPRSCANRK